MIKSDFKKELRELFGPPAGDFVLVTVPDLSFLMVDGMGDPATARNYIEAVEVLDAVSYAVKVASKKELDPDLVVPLWKGSGGPTTRRLLWLVSDTSGVGR